MGWCRRAPMRKPAGSRDQDLVAVHPGDHRWGVVTGHYELTAVDVRRDLLTVEVADGIEDREEAHAAGELGDGGVHAAISDHFHRRDRAVEATENDLASQ